jgi:glycogen(starch) synthase
MLPLRCLLLSYVFAPSVGGIESVSRVLASALAERGHRVRVVTMTAAGPPTPDAKSDGELSTKYDVVRRPDIAALYSHLRWSDVVLQSNFSLRLAWPLALMKFPRPWVVVHHTPLTRPSGELSSRDRFKRWSLRRAHCYSVSRYLAATTPGVCDVLYNPYDDDQFGLLSDARRDVPLLFVGRLVPAKGVDVLVKALGCLRQQSIAPRLTVVGNGPQLPDLQALSRHEGVEGQISFVGPKQGRDLVREMNRHQIIVVPSRPAPPEALGMVALEGIACGCVAIGADQGGLPEAIGPCGVTFESESAPDLALKIRDLLESPQRRAALRAARDGFLRDFARPAVLDRYEAAIERAVATRG